MAVTPHAITSEQPGDGGGKPLDSLAQQVLDNERERRRRKGPGFSVITNPQNPPAPWNDMTAELTLILSLAVRTRLGLDRRSLKSGRKTGSSAA